MGLQETLKALSEPIRRDILNLLKNGRLSAGDIANHFDLSQATVSHHLSLLKKAGLIVETKYKNYRYYDINVSVFEEVMLWLSQFTGGENNESESME